MTFDDVGVRIEVQVPHGLQQHGAGDDLSRVPHQIFQKRVFARLKVDLLAGAADFASEAIDFEVGDAERGIGRDVAGAAAKGLDPGGELGKGKRFDQIVVPAGPETPHPVVDLTECEFIDSSAVRAVLLSREAQHPQEGAERLAVAASSEQILRILSVMGLDRVIPIRSTVEEAASAITG